MLQKLVNQAELYVRYGLFFVFLHGNTWFHGLKADPFDQIIGQAESFDNFLFGTVTLGFVDRIGVHSDLLIESMLPFRTAQRLNFANNMPFPGLDSKRHRVAADNSIHCCPARKKPAHDLARVR